MRGLKEHDLESSVREEVCRFSTQYDKCNQTDIVKAISIIKADRKEYHVRKQSIFSDRFCHNSSKLHDQHQVSAPTSYAPYDHFNGGRHPESQIEQISDVFQCNSNYYMSQLAEEVTGGIKLLPLQIWFTETIYILPVSLPLVTSKQIKF